MARLTNDIRAEICKKILNHGFGQRQAEFLKEEKELADKVYNRQYPAAVRTHMQALPKSFLLEAENVTVYVGGESIQLTLAESRRIAKMYAYQYDEKFALDSDDELAKAVRKHAHAKKKFKEEYKEAKNKAESVLDSVKTTSRLLEVWPEIEMWVKPFESDDKPVITTLAIPIASLNRVLDLPPEQSTKK